MDAHLSPTRERVMSDSTQPPTRRMPVPGPADAPTTSIPAMGERPSLGATPAVQRQARRLAPEFMARPRRVRVLTALAVLAAVVLPLTLPVVEVVRVHNPALVTVGVLLLLSVLNVEMGRVLDGGVADSQRPHKALSAWGFASALLLPTPWLLVVVPVCYVHARWRGLRVALWKWVLSAAYVILASVAGGLVAHRVQGADPNWMAGEGGRGLVAVTIGALAFLAVETLLLHGSAYLNSAEDEVWLRRTLAAPTFYVTEAAVLLVGGLSAAIWTGGGWFLLLVVPIYLLGQRAALHDTLKEAADTDDKTGLLRYESWRRLAKASQQRLAARGEPWTVVFADLDHFKDYNDTHGHLVGDLALAAVADAMRAQVRAGDLVGRFGGEEFCVFLPGALADEAEVVAERIRTAVAALALPDSGASVTLSLGVASAEAGGEATLADGLSQADHALYEAKIGGRDRVCLRPVPAERDSGFPDPGSSAT